MQVGNVRGPEKVSRDFEDPENTAGPERAPRIRLPSFCVVMTYLFFEDFFPPFLPPFFLAAMLFTTFHAVRDLPVALTWQSTGPEGPASS
jgi:hypothetical protein